MRFGLMFFAASEEALGQQKYHVVIECARFGDRHGFSSVWVPERHFTHLGSLYPNPAVLHAALARETQQIGLRAGSVVLPLHNPLRVAEEWAVVDNLSDGRVGISFASGWNPNDFAFFPDRYARRGDELFASIQVVQKLWRGETIAATSGSGAPIDLRIYPTPVQPELPVWVTAAGNPQTFARAGAIGAHLLTHVLDQSIETLAANIAVYRQARAAHGHAPDAGQVTVMVHTFVGADAGVVHEQARRPYCEYLKANIGLLRGLAQSRGQSFDITTMAPEDIDSFVAMLYERFATSRGLIGTPETCLDVVRQLSAAGADEVACLLDFGPSVEQILNNLPHLLGLKERWAAETAAQSRRDDAGAPVAAAAQTSVAAAPDALADAQARCADEISASAFYADLLRYGVEMET
jgi:natural product biosynthesis luciferase-like monooxygenase protein